MQWKIPPLARWSMLGEFHTQTLLENLSSLCFHLSTDLVDSGQQTRAKQRIRKQCAVIILPYPAHLVLQNSLETQDCYICVAGLAKTDFR